MDLIAAARAAAPAAPLAATQSLEAARPALARLGVLDSPWRAAHLIGQCAHESMGLARREESLRYTSAARLMTVWPGRFGTVAAAEPFLRQPERLAEHVYGGRMGNDRPGDGWRYRGRGWLHLTGRANYREFGAAIGRDLEAAPEAAADPDTSWALAGAYFGRRRRAGLSALDWADRDDAGMVTRIVNGGTHGLSDRLARTGRALAALAGLDALAARLAPGARGATVLAAQIRLAAAGHAPGPVDGVYGPRTVAALARAGKAVA